MTDGEAFLLVFVFIYLSDCLVWLPPAGCALIAYWTRRHFVRRATVQFSAMRRGFAVLQALPPLGSVFVGQSWPVSLTRDGIAPSSRDHPNPGPVIKALSNTTFLPWDMVERVRSEGSLLRINGKPFAQCATSAGAVQLAAVVRAVLLASPDCRDELIECRVRRTLDERRARRRARFFRSATQPLRFSAGALFVVVFLMVPFAYWRFHDDPRFLITLGAAWVLMWQVTIEFWLIHRRFYPSLKSDRWQHSVLSLMFPQYAIRSLDALSKGFLAESHPVAMAAAVARPDEFHRFASSVQRDTRHPIPLADPADSEGVAAEIFRERYFQPAFEALLARNAPPQASEKTAVIVDAVAEAPAICPRCATPYESPGLPCEDCGGLITVVAPTAN